MNKLLSTLIALSMLFISCSDGQDDTNNNSEWLIPSGEIFDGGPGKDGIPSVDQANFSPSVQIDYMNDDDLIIAFKSGDIVKGYTHRVLDWHEIINDQVSDISLAITYCPLTGTSIGWDRNINGNISTFGVSGLLYNTNLLPYDRATGSNWSQMRLECVNGKLIGQKPVIHQLTEMSWKTWKMMFSTELVITTETGFTRNYESYPYFNSQGKDYRVDNWLLFPITPSDNRLEAKERVLGVIINENAKAYRLKSFSGQTISIKEDNFGGKNLIVIGSEAMNLLAAFENDLELTGLVSESGANGIVMSDSEGNKWNIFGEAKVGPRMGQKLKNVNSFMGYWFSWGAFYPGLEIFEN